MKKLVFLLVCLFTLQTVARDNSNVILATKIILLNGFLKKSTKDYDKQIAKAIRILKDLAL